MSRLRLLVAIANHGTKNQKYLDAVLNAYRAMPHQVDLVVLSDAPKDLGEDVEVLVGTPIDDPRSLPYAHRRLFCERRNDYDLFIYSEDDTPVTPAAIDAFLEASAVLPDDEIPGFLRYEVDERGGKSYCSAHSGFHWRPDTVHEIGGLTFAEFSNDHGAVYLLTRDQLRRAIASGGFDIAPHSGRYSMMVSAATDPYTRCGMRKVMYLDRLEDMILHHLPNKYLGHMGIDVEDWSAQLHALTEVASGHVSAGRLFPTESGLDSYRWDRKYHPRQLTLPEVTGVARVLSVGCGSGAAERAAFPDADITAIPLDEVIAAVARRRGIRTLPPNFTTALAALKGEHFDVVLLDDVIQRLDEPVATLRALRPLVDDGGHLVATVPNLLRSTVERMVTRERFPMAGDLPFATSRLHPVSSRQLQRWLRIAGFESTVSAAHQEQSRRITALLPSRVTGRVLMADARPVGASIQELDSNVIQDLNRTIQPSAARQS